MEKWFNKQSKLVKIALLLIPVVNWVVEVLIRWPHYLKKNSLIRLVLAIIATVPSGLVLAYVDAVLVALTDKVLKLD